MAFEDLPQVIDRALAADVRFMIVTGLTAALSQAAHATEPCREALRALRRSALG